MLPFRPVDFGSKATSLTGLEVSDLPFMGKGINKRASVKVKYHTKETEQFVDSKQIRQIYIVNI